MAKASSIPDQVTRDRLVAACEAVGLDPTRVKNVRMDAHTITAEVYEVDEEGRKYLNTTQDGFTTRTVHIAVID